MLDIEIKMHLQKLGMVARVLMGIPAGDLLREFSLNDTLGPLMDPTGWMTIRDNNQKNERLVRGLADFQKVIRESWPEIATTDGEEGDGQ